MGVLGSLCAVLMAVGLCVSHLPRPLYLTLDMDMDGSMYRKAQSGEHWYDPGVFAYLEGAQVPATFFVSGLFLKAYPALVSSLASSSAFAFENHSWNESAFVPHCYSLPTLASTTQKIAQIARTESIIAQVTGERATYFRFPGACADAADALLVERLGYTVNDGTLIVGDPFDTKTAAMVAYVLSHATSSATILMHVGGPNAPMSLAVLRAIVPALRAQGYTFEKL